MKSSKISREGTAASQKPASGVKQKAQNLPKGWADWLSSRTTHFKRSQWLIVLALFVLLAGGYSSYLMLDSFQWNGKAIFLILPIRKPAFFHDTGEIQAGNRAVLPSGEYERIHRFRLYMDSLAESTTGKKTYDSLLLHRPGLMDSLHFIEKHYQPATNH